MSSACLLLRRILHERVAPLKRFGIAGGVAFDGMGFAWHGFTVRE
jgi:hypothetical protein